MKIEKRGIRITDLPQFIAIEVRADGSILMEDIRFDVPAEFGRVFTADEAREIRDALNVALGEGPEQRWDRIEDVPKGVAAVLDKDGDPWRRRPDDRDGYFAGETFEYLNHYAPFRRA